MITDGGHNDSDGQVNGIIVDPGAPARGIDSDRNLDFGPNCVVVVEVSEIPLTTPAATPSPIAVVVPLTFGSY